MVRFLMNSHTTRVYWMRNNAVAIKGYDIILENGIYNIGHLQHYNIFQSEKNTWLYDDGSLRSVQFCENYIKTIFIRNYRLLLWSSVVRSMIHCQIFKIAYI